MKLIDRYVGWQVLLTSTIAVAVLSMVLVLGKVFKELLELLVRSDTPPEQILTFLAYILPFSLTFTIPWGFLTAVLLVFGKMSGENELIALRATGVSISRITFPVLVLAVASVAICLWINVDVAPRAQAKMKEALYTMATSNPMAMFGSDKVIEAFPGKKIFVERHVGAELSNLLIYETDDDFLPVKVVFAKRGKLETDRERKQILLHLFDARYEQRDADEPENLLKIRTATARENTLEISLEELSEKKRGKGIGSMTAGELLARINADQADAKMNEKDRREALSAGRTELRRRYAYALASFAFALIGVPLAITAIPPQRRGRRDLFFREHVRLCAAHECAHLPGIFDLAAQRALPRARRVALFSDESEVTPENCACWKISSFERHALRFTSASEAEPQN